MTDNPVVRKVAPLTEELFRATFLQSLNRMIATHGRSRVAQWLGVTERQLGNYGNGSLPTADRIWNLLAHDISAHDELDRCYGQRKVPEHAVCSTDPIAAQLARVLTKAIEAEDPDSPGGQEVTLGEIRTMDERAMRAAHKRLGSWITRLDDERAPRSMRIVR